MNGTEIALLRKAEDICMDGADTDDVVELRHRLKMVATLLDVALADAQAEGVLTGEASLTDEQKGLIINLLDGEDLLGDAEKDAIRVLMGGIANAH
jgi:hypothetical protein